MQYNNALSSLMYTSEESHVEETGRSEPLASAGRLHRNWDALRQACDA